MLLAYRDAQIEINAGFTGLHSIVVTCRNFKQTFTNNEITPLMALLYPGIDAAAKAVDTTPEPSTP